MSPVHDVDVAQAFVNSLSDNSTIGKTYKLGGPDILSWTEKVDRPFSNPHDETCRYPFRLAAVLSCHSRSVNYAS